MKEKIFKTKSGVELYVDFADISYETTNIQEIREALNTDLKSQDIIARATAREVLNILDVIDNIRKCLN